MDKIQSEEFSKWFISLCRKCRIPIEIASGASAMVANLSTAYWSRDRCRISCVACIRIAYKWVYDDFYATDLAFMDQYTGQRDPINWLSVESGVFADLGWRVREYFEDVSQLPAWSVRDNTPAIHKQGPARVEPSPARADAVPARSGPVSAKVESVPVRHGPVPSRYGQIPTASRCEPARKLVERPRTLKTVDELLKK